MEGREREGKLTRREINKNSKEGNSRSVQVRELMGIK